MEKAPEKCTSCINGTWVLQTYFRNGTDETNKLFIKNYTETYVSPDKYGRTYLDSAGTAQYDTSGTYAFDADVNLDIKGVSSIQNFSAANTSVSSSTYIVDVLKVDQYWYSYTNGGDTHQFRMIKQ